MLLPAKTLIEDWGFPDSAARAIHTEYLELKYQDDPIYDLYWSLILRNAENVSKMATGDHAVIPYTLCRNLRGVALRTTTLDYMDADEVDLQSAWLRGTSFVGTSLVNADMRHIAMEKVRFYAADMEGVDMSGGSAWYCDFQLANLCGAKLPTKGTKECQFQGAVYNEHTVFPEGFNPEAEGMTKA